MPQNANGTYTAFVDGRRIGVFGLIAPNMKGVHVRTIRARDGVTDQHRLFIDGSHVSDNVVVSPNAKVEFRSSEVTA